MHPVQFGLLIVFAKEIHTQPLALRLLEAISGEAKIAEPIPEKGLKLTIDEDKMSVIWNPAHCRIATENVTDRRHSTDIIISLLNRIDEIAPIDKIKERSVITCWILPAPDYDFTSLERKYRSLMVAKSNISDDAFDSSAIFDIRVNKWVLHHQSGAMNPKQLMHDYLRFKPDNLSKVFIFLEATITAQDMVKYSRDNIRSFIEKSLDYCADHAEAFNQLWEGQL